MAENSSSNDVVQELRKRVEGQRFVMLTSADTDGSLVSRPMTVQEVSDWTLSFIVQESNDVTSQSDGKFVNLAIVNGGDYVSLSGTGRINRSVEDKRELWNRLNEAYAGDAEDPANVILEITVDKGEYWDAGNPVVRVLGLAKAAITGEPPAGDHGVASI